MKNNWKYMAAVALGLVGHSPAAAQNPTGNPNLHSVIANSSAASEDVEQKATAFYQAIKDQQGAEILVTPNYSRLSPQARQAKAKGAQNSAALSEHALEKSLDKATVAAKMACDIFSDPNKTANSPKEVISYGMNLYCRKKPAMYNGLRDDARRQVTETNSLYGKEIHLRGVPAPLPKVSPQKPHQGAKQRRAYQKLLIPQ